MILFLDHLGLAQQDVQCVSETVGPVEWKGSAFVTLWLMSPVHIRLYNLDSTGGAVTQMPLPSALEHEFSDINV